MPLPIVLDTDLRFSPRSRLLKNYKDKKGKQPVIFTGIRVSGGDPQWDTRREQLNAEGARIISIPSENGICIPF